VYCICVGGVFLLDNIIKADLKTIIKIVFIISFCISILLVLFAVSSLIISKTDFSYEALYPLTSAILAVSAALCGFEVSKLLKENGLIWGVFSGIIISTFIIILAVIFKTLAFNSVFITKIIITIISGAAGGIIGVNTN